MGKKLILLLLILSGGFVYSQTPTEVSASIDSNVYSNAAHKITGDGLNYTLKRVAGLGNISANSPVSYDNSSHIIGIDTSIVATQYRLDTTRTGLTTRLTTTISSGVGVSVVQSAQSFTVSSSISVDLFYPGTIYVSSGVNGKDTSASDWGTINRPYATLDYVVANVVNTGTISCNTNTSKTISGISDVDNALLSVGDYLAGTGIPYRARIVTKGDEGGDANTVTLSIAATATAAITGTWETPYLIRASGAFTPTATIYKDGFNYEFTKGSTVKYGAFYLFTVSAAMISDLNVKGGYFIGTATTSAMYVNATAQNVASFATFDDIYVQSVTTGNLFVGGSISAANCNIKIANSNITASAGKVVYSYLSIIEINKSTLYGALGGVAGTSSKVIIDGKIETPAAILALNSVGYPGSNNIRGEIIGSVVIQNRSNKNDIYADITGTTLTVSSSSDIGQTTNFYGAVSAALTMNAAASSTTFYGNFNGTVTLSNGSLTMKNFTLGTSTLSGGALTLDFTNPGVAGSYTFGSIAVTGADLIINGKAVITVSGFLNATSGRVILNGELDVSFINSLATSPLINGATWINNGTIRSTNASTSIPLLRKTTGDLILTKNSRFVVGNGKSPIYCTANTAASKDIYLFDCMTNCDGATYGVLIPFDGASFTPNDLVGGVLRENTAYNW